LRKDKYVYLVEQVPEEKDHQHLVNILDEIPKGEVDDLFAAQWFSVVYHKITQVKNVVVENGKDFQDFMLSSNIARLRQNKMKPDKLTKENSKRVLYSSKFEPLPMDNIFEAFEELKRNPMVTIMYENSNQDESI